MDEQPELQPELKDILEMIHRYNATNYGGCFMFAFLGFKKNNEINEDDTLLDIADESRSMVGAFGDLLTLRSMITGIRDLIEDEVDEDDFINI